MPRQKALRELVDDHQLVTAAKFAALGHVLAFSSLSDLMEQLPALGHFRPKVRQPNVGGVAAAIGDYLTGLVSAHRPDET
jgi:UDP-N-acetylglucosamine transferase subunit ALG13